MPVKAFIDSGAEITLMGEACAEVTFAADSRTHGACTICMGLMRARRTSDVYSFCDVYSSLGLPCEQALGLMRLLDTNFRGTAVGVGKGRILGRIHHAEMLLGSQTIHVSIAVLEGTTKEFIFGEK